MRIRHSFLLVLAAATLVTGCGSGGRGATPRMWEPDDALQRADKALGEAVGDGRVTMRGTGFLATGLDKTLEAAGEVPYRFDIACDSEESPGSGSCCRAGAAPGTVPSTSRAARSARSPG